MSEQEKRNVRKLANKQGLCRLVRKLEIEKTTKETFYKHVKKLTKDVNGLKRNITGDIVNQLGGLSWILSKAFER